MRIFRRKRRHLNIPLLKGQIMGALSLAIGLGSAFTGLGAQLAAAPTIDFMLGYGAEKAAGTALVVALCAAVSGVSAAHACGTPVHAGPALLVTFGATIGVMVFGTHSASQRLMQVRMYAQSAVVLALMVVMSYALRGGVLGPEPLDMPWARGSLGLLVLGAVCGFLSAACEVSTGALLVPGLVFVGALRPDEAIAISLVVVAVASILPILGHLATGRLDKQMCGWMGGGAALGGAIGGWLLARCHQPVHPAPLLACASIAIFLSAAYMYRNSGFSDDVPDEGQDPGPDDGPKRA